MAGYFSLNSLLQMLLAKKEKKNHFSQNFIMGILPLSRNRISKVLVPFERACRVIFNQEFNQNIVAFFHL